jgi:hypothetical protein
MNLNKIFEKVLKEDDTFETARNPKIEKYKEPNDKLWIDILREFNLFIEKGSNIVQKYKPNYDYSDIILYLKKFVIKHCENALKDENERVEYNIMV